MTYDMTSKIQKITYWSQDYGEDLGYGDRFLAWLGACAAIFNASGRVIWGQLMDKFSYKVRRVNRFYIMMTSSNGNILRVTGPLCGEFTGPGEFPTQRPVTRSFDVFFDLRLNKRLSKQTRGWWFETQSWSLWRHCNVLNCFDERLDIFALFVISRHWNGIESLPRERLPPFYYA